MEHILTIVIGFVGRKTRLPLVCKSWRDVITKYDEYLIRDIHKRYQDIESISEIFLIAMRNKDYDTIRRITTEYFGNVSLSWELLSSATSDPTLCWYFSFRVKDPIELARISEIYIASHQFTRSHVVQLSHKYTKIDMMKILKCGVLPKIWPWMTQVQQQRISTLLQSVVKLFYQQKIERNTYDDISVINLMNVPNPKVTIPWLYHHGFLKNDIILDSIMRDDPSMYVTPPDREQSYAMELILEFNAVNIYTARIPSSTLFPFAELCSEEFVDISIHNEDALINSLVMNRNDLASKVNIMYKLWHDCKSIRVQEYIYKLAITQKCISMIDVFMTKKNHLRVIIDAIQPHGMYDTLYDLLIFRGIQADWFSYYLRHEIDPIQYIPGHLIDTKKNMIVIPSNVYDWKALYDAIVNVRSKLNCLSGTRAPSDKWPIFIGAAILYDKKGAFLTALIREHACEITPKMVIKMRDLFQKNPRDGGWEGFSKSMIDAGVPIHIASI